MNLGNVCILEGKSAEGISRYEKALAACETGGFARLEAQVRFNLGLALVPMGQPEVALNHFRTARTLLRRMASPMVGKVEIYISRLNDMLRKRNAD